MCLSKLHLRMGTVFLVMIWNSSARFYSIQRQRIYKETPNSFIPEETVSVLKDALTDYRTKAFKLHRVKPYEVFKNLSRDRIAKFAPRTLEELRDLRCLDEAQLTLYGEEIIDVVNGILNK